MQFWLDVSDKRLKWVSCCGKDGICQRSELEDRTKILVSRNQMALTLKSQSAKRIKVGLGLRVRGVVSEGLRVVAEKVEGILTYQGTIY